MKTKTLLLIGAGLVLTSTSGLAQPTIASELERGVELLEAGEDLQKAKEHLEMVIHRKRESEKLAAEAYYHLAKCELALGERERARKLVALLRKDWPADNPWVIRAGKLPLRESIFREAPWASGERMTWEWKFGDEGQDEESGRFSSLIVASGAEGEERWTMWAIGETELSFLEFGGDDYRLIKGRVESPHIGVEQLETKEDGTLVVRSPGSEKPVASFAPGKEREALYHTLQMMELVRVLPARMDGPVELPFVDGWKPAEPSTFTFVKLGEETVEAPVGTIGCDVYEVRTSGNAPFDKYWVEKDGPRRVIKLTVAGGQMTSTLVSWEPKVDLEEASLFKSGNLQLKLPAGLVAMADPEADPLFEQPNAKSVGLYDTRSRVWAGLLVTLPVAEDQQEELQKARLTDEMVNEMAKGMSRKLSMLSPDPVKVVEVKGNRTSHEVDGVEHGLTRFAIERGTFKYERSLLVGYKGGVAIVIYFDHEKGAGVKAVELLKEIRKGL